MRMTTLAIPRRVVLCTLLLGAALGCTDGSNAAADASSSSEESGSSSDAPSPDVTSANAPSLDAPIPDPRPCVGIPAVCPAQQPSYARDIAPIFATKCNTCHSEEVDSGPWPLTEYSYILDWQSAVVADIQYCTMPPVGAPTLTSAEQNAILAWMVCNAPDN